MDVIVDDIAERAAQLGSKAIATLEEFKQLSEIKEHPNQYPDANKMLSNLFADHEKLSAAQEPMLIQSMKSTTTSRLMTF